MKELKKFAVIGSPIEHSLSPKIHSLFAESLGIKISYEALKVEEVEFTTRAVSYTHLTLPTSDLV